MTGGGFVNSKESRLNTTSSKQLGFRYYFEIVVVVSRSAIVGTSRLVNKVVNMDID